jgi:ADP-ribosylglycohydrolase
MLGAIIGDIVGSVYEWNNIKHKEFELFSPEAFFTDDTVLTVALAEAITAFLEAEDFEDAIRNAISLGGDSDTLACITGGIAEAFFGIPEEIAAKALGFLDEQLRKTVAAFYQEYRQNFKTGLPIRLPRE